MVFLRSGVTAVLVVCSLLAFSSGIPLVDKLKRLSPPARDILKRSTPAAPHFVAYNDGEWLDPLPAASDLKGYTVFALSFLLTSGAVNEARNFEDLSASDRSSYLSEYSAAGIYLVVSAFGPIDIPTSSGADPTATANTLAAWIIQYGLNGIDVYYRDFNAFNSGSAETWLISFTQTLRQQLPLGEYILTHAPDASWFSPSMWSGGGYLAVDISVGYLIDWYNVQFYDQGVTEYTTCEGLLTEPSLAWPETALFQIAANGVSLDKLVIGKPATGFDASNGYMEPAALASCVSQAVSHGWDAGVAVWEYPYASSSWITTVRGDTWPVGGTTKPKHQEVTVSLHGV